VDLETEAIKQPRIRRVGDDGVLFLFVVFLEALQTVFLVTEARLGAVGFLGVDFCAVRQLGS
jgi:hypothetical protein